MTRYPAATQMLNSGRHSYMFRITNALAKIEETRIVMKTSDEYEVRVAAEELIDSLYGIIEREERDAEERLQEWATD